MLISVLPLLGYYMAGNPLTYRPHFHHYLPILVALVGYFKYLYKPSTEEVSLQPPSYAPAKVAMPNIRRVPWSALEKEGARHGV
jgi:hypothetical protein